MIAQVPYSLSTKLYTIFGVGSGGPFQIYYVGVIVLTNTHFWSSQHNEVSLEPPLKAPHAIGLTYEKGAWSVYDRDLSPFSMRLPPSSQAIETKFKNDFAAVSSR